ncbi:hypothetical protein D3C81_2089480 [compost metagenome]
MMRLEQASKLQKKNLIEHPRSSRPSIEKSRNSAPQKLKSGTTSKGTPPKDQTILIANLQRNLEITQLSLKQLKVVLAIMTGIALASVALLVVIAH